MEQVTKNQREELPAAVFEERVSATKMAKNYLTVVQQPDSVRVQPIQSRVVSESATRVAGGSGLNEVT